MYCPYCSQRTVSEKEEDDEYFLEISIMITLKDENDSLARGIEADLSREEPQFWHFGYSKANRREKTVE